MSCRVDNQWPGELGGRVHGFRVLAIWALKMQELYLDPSLLQKPVVVGTLTGTRKGFAVGLS